jgi:hypothetical protein
MARAAAAMGATATVLLQVPVAVAGGAIVVRVAIATVVLGDAVVVEAVSAPRMTVVVSSGVGGAGVGRGGRAGQRHGYKHPSEA